MLTLSLDCLAGMSSRAAGWRGNAEQRAASRQNNEQTAGRFGNGRGEGAKVDERAKEPARASLTESIAARAECMKPGSQLRKVNVPSPF